MDDEMTPIDNDEMMDLFGDGFEEEVTEVSTEVPEVPEETEISEETPLEEDILEQTPAKSKKLSFSTNPPMHRSRRWKKTREKALLYCIQITCRNSLTLLERTASIN